MRYYVDRTCVDFSGRLYVEGDIVELAEGKHNAHLIPMPDPEPETETPEAEEIIGDTEEEPVEEPVEEPAPAPKKTSRKKAAATTEAEG